MYQMMNEGLVLGLRLGWRKCLSVTRRPVTVLEGCRGRPFAFERHMSGVVQLTPELTKALEHRIEALPTKRVNAKQRRTASVFVPLIHNTRQTQGNKVIQELSVLFTVRTNNVSTHKGQVSFPGGHIDQTETPEEAATREFIEEVHNLPEKPIIIGRLPECVAVTGTHVTPVLGFIPGSLDLSKLVANPNEVSQLFALSLSTLLDSRNYYVEKLKVPYGGESGMNVGFRNAKIPVYLGGIERVWGLTAYILDNCLREVILPSVNYVYSDSRCETLQLPCVPVGQY